MTPVIGRGTDGLDRTAVIVPGGRADRLDRIRAASVVAEAAEGIRAEVIEAEGSKLGRQWVIARDGVRRVGTHVDFRLVS